MTTSQSRGEMTEYAPSATLTSRLLALANTWQHPDIDAAYDHAERAYVDTLACALAASGDPAVVTASETLASPSVPDHANIPAPLRYDLDENTHRAALLGGLSAHALDYDDVDDATISHPSAVLVPTTLTIAARMGSTGHEIVDAYWAGLAASRLVGSAVGIPGHYGAGWHSTATVGTIAATVSAARLLRLPAEHTAHALGIAGSLAAGSRQNFGTMTKPLHAGTSAANAVLAGTLAAGGFTADPVQLEGPLGFVALHRGEPGHEDRSSVADRLASDTEIGTLGVNVKLYPCCYFIHAAADAMHELHADGLRAQDVRSIDVCVQPDGLAPLIHNRPRTGLQGKFSMQYAIAAAVLDGRLTLGSFTDEAVNRTEAQELIPLVTPRTSQTPPVGPATWDAGYAVVSVEIHDGRRLTRRVDRPQGHASRPVSDDQMRAKFDDCLRAAGFRPADEAFSALRDLRQATSVRDVLARVRQAIGLGTSHSDARATR